MAGALAIAIPLAWYAQKRYQREKSLSAVVKHSGVGAGVEQLTKRGKEYCPANHLRERKNRRSKWFSYG